jgi:crossover junction endodeoxyribonuclease RuvC
MRRAMRILGVDPGSRVTGFGVVDCAAGRTSLRAYGCVRTGDGALPARVAEIYRGVAAIITEHAPDEMAVEAVFIARGADAALKLGQARGAVIAAGAQAGLDVHEYAARRVKSAVAGTGAASKEQVQRMVALLLGMQEVPQSDAADALAIALCHARCAESPLRFAAPRRRGRARLRVLG